LDDYFNSIDVEFDCMEKCV